MYTIHWFVVYMTLSSFEVLGRYTEYTGMISEYTKKAILGWVVSNTDSVLLSISIVE